MLIQIDAGGIKTVLQVNDGEIYTKYTNISIADRGHLNFY